MPRKKRTWFPGAKLHITSRGIRRTTLFHDDEDRIEYLRILQDIKQIKPFELHTYCLMTNHIHLQLQPLEHHPGKILQQLHLKYAKYFNQKYHFSGHVFESRYGSELLTTVEYELEVNKYIHLNPIRANMVQELKDYKWSSYFDYVHPTNSTLVSTERIFTFFPEPKIDNYQKFLQAKVQQEKKHVNLNKG
ncbi:transposase [Aquibacillus sediminis]|uniref:transposase n=1 Tax=Aquibacillus sediminis TaxID=2574734 RepID=UPI001485EBA4|nr:transposase [Aquibacillus sediminis]